MQRNGALVFYQYLATKSGVPVIQLSRNLLSKRKQRYTTIAAQLQALHICPSLELKFVVLVKRVEDDLLGFKRKNKQASSTQRRRLARPVN